MSQVEEKVDVEEVAQENDQAEDTGRRRSTRARAPPVATTPAPKKDPKAAKGGAKKGAKKDPKQKKGGKKKGSDDEDSDIEIIDDKPDKMDDEEEEIKEVKETKEKKDDDFDDEDEVEEEPSEEDDEEEDDFDEKPKKKGKGAAKPAPAAKKGKAAEKTEKKAPATKAPAAKGKKKAKESDDEDDFNDDSDEVKPKGKGGAAKKGAPAKKGKKDEDDGSPVDDDTVLEYMKKANRPYSLINICDNLHGKIKKTALQKMLDGLVSKNKLTCKEFGKAKIYLMNQDLLPQVDKSELEQMQNDLNEKRVYLREIGEEIKELTKKIATYNKQLTNAQIQEEIVKNEKMIKQLEDKMHFYQSDKFVQASEADVKKYEEAYQKMEKEYKRRRRMCKDGIGQIAEGMNKKLSEVQELIGIEEEDE
ncbi:hypothetical protein ABPG74_019283 [Tetrahymena malaccensis]